MTQLSLLPSEDSRPVPEYLAPAVRVARDVAKMMSVVRRSPGKPFTSQSLSAAFGVTPSYVDSLMGEMASREIVDVVDISIDGLSVVKAWVVLS